MEALAVASAARAKVVATAAATAAMGAAATTEAARAEVVPAEELVERSVRLYPMAHREAILAGVLLAEAALEPFRAAKTVLVEEM